MSFSLALHFGASCEIISRKYYHHGHLLAITRYNRAKLTTAAAAARGQKVMGCRGMSVWRWLVVGRLEFMGQLESKTLAPNLDVVVIEKGKPLSKVKVSGEGRCNVTNGRCSDNMVNN